MTEVRDVVFLDENPEFMTTLRWLSEDRKNPMYRIVLSITRKMKVMGKDEYFDFKSLKTQIIFMASQFALTTVSMIPSVLMYYSFFLNVSFLVFFLTVAVFNGAGYYIEVFSVRYADDLNSKTGSVRTKPPGQRKTEENQTEKVM